MKYPLRLPTVALLLFSAAAFAAPLALINVTIIDATGKAPIENGVIVMDRGRITAVGAESTTKIPRGAKVLDEKGKYIIPGLMDANVHLYINLDAESLITLRSRYADVIVEAAQLALKTGQTTVFDTWGPYPDLKMARDRIDRGKEVGARIFFAGNIIGFGGPASADFTESYTKALPKDMVDKLNQRWTQGAGRELLWDTPEEVSQKIARYAALDVDFLKYTANGHTLNEMSLAEFSQRSQNAIVKAGHDAGKTVQAHVHSLEGMKGAMTAGVNILTHCDATPTRTTTPEVIKFMVEKGVYCSVLPTTKAYQATQPEEMRPFFVNSLLNIKNMLDAGVPLMLSTDAGIHHPIPAMPGRAEVDNRTALGEGHFAALRGLEEIGVDPMVGLQMATINVAKGYKVEKDFGTLEEGKYADMVVLSANPLIAARNYEAISLVIKAGEIIDLSKLPSTPLISNQKIQSED